MGIKKSLALLTVLLVLSTGFALAQETDQGVLKGLYHVDAAGYSTGSVRTSGNGWQDCVFDAEAYRENVNSAAPRYVFENGEDILLYRNGYMLVRSADGRRTALVRAKDGSEVFSDESLGVTGIATPGRYRKMLEDGLVMVYNMEESLNGVEYAFGILNTAGEWVLPLSADHALLNGCLDISSEVFTGEHRLFYNGEGCFLFDAYDEPFRMMLYNAEEDRVYPLVLPEDNKELRGTIQRNIELEAWDWFEEGRSLYSYLIGKRRLFALDAHGTLSAEIVFDYDWLPKSGGDRFGGHYMSEDSDGRYVQLAQSDGAAWLVYSSGEVYQLGTFKLIDVLQFGDFWMVAAQNSEGSAYYFALDEKGTFLFEPVRTDAIELLLADGSILECTEDRLDQYGPKQMVSFDGSVLYESSAPERSLGLNNGVLCEYIHNAAGADEELLYVDMREALNA